MTDDPLAGLPPLEPRTRYDAALRQHPADPIQFARLAKEAAERLAIARPRGDRRAVFRLLVYLGEAERVLGHSAAAIAHHAESLAVARALGEPRSGTGSLIRLGEAHRYADDPATAEAHFRAALARIEADRSALGIYEDFALQHLGKCLIDQGRAAEAIAALERALTLRREKGDAALIESTEAALRLARGVVS